LNWIDLMKAFKLLFLLICFLATLQAASAGQTDFNDLPLPARVVLTKINPMLQANEINRAVETLLAFQSRSGAVPAIGEADPKGYHHPEIYYILGNCHLLLEDYPAAVTAFRQATTRNATHTFAWLNLAKAQYELQHYSEAGRAFGRGYETAEEQDPRHLYFSAAAYLMAGDHFKSIEVFAQLLARHPTAIQPLWREHLVQALLSADQPRRALPHIRLLAQTYTGDKQIQWQEILLYQYLNLDMGAEALALATDLVHQTPQIAKWWKALTHIQLNAGRQEKALAALIIYSFCTPLTMEEQQLLADLHLQVGIPVKAVEGYQTAYRQKPEKQLLLRLVQAYRLLGLEEAAIEQIEVFDAYNGNDDPSDHCDPGDPGDLCDVDLVLLKAELLYGLKRFEQAAAAYQQAARQKGDHSGRAWLMAGYAAWQVDDLTAGRKAFRRAVAYEDQKEAAGEALAQLGQGTGVP
jgi:tetratricopeptide (TPR) repeat protein